MEMLFVVVFLLGFIICATFAIRVDNEMAERDAELEALRRALGV